jgi:DNA-binding transcriptional LysR family regulator
MTTPLNHPLPVLELDVLRTFVAIAETRSFSSAANAVFRTPSAVSMQIKKLEDTLGRVMFTRDARSVTLTPDGEVLLGYARRLLAINREAVSKFVVPEISGVVHLGAPDSVGDSVLPSILKRFARTHPQISVDVTIDQSSSLRRRVEERRLDIALMVCGYELVPDGAELVKTEEIVWAGAKGGSAHMCRPLPISVWEEGCQWRSGGVGALEKSGIDYRIAYMSAYGAGQRAAILSDLAIAPLPRSSAGSDFVILGECDGLPRIGSYSIAMVVRPDADSAVLAAADHIRAAFASDDDAPARRRG